MSCKLQHLIGGTRYGFCYPRLIVTGLEFSIQGALQPRRLEIASCPQSQIPQGLKSQTSLTRGRAWGRPVWHSQVLGFLCSVSMLGRGLFCLFQSEGFLPNSPLSSPLGTCLLSIGQGQPRLQMIALSQMDSLDRQDSGVGERATVPPLHCCWDVLPWILNAGKQKKQKKNKS